MEVGVSVSIRAKTLSSLGVIAAGIVALLINVLAARHYRRWDATRGRLYTLSDPTNFTLDSLEHDARDVELFVFIGAGDPLLSSIKQILVTYQARAAKHLHVRYLDPDRDRAEFMRLQTELEVNAKAENGRILSDAQIVARHGTRVWYVKTDDLLVMEEGDDVKVRPRVESAITSAIRAVLSTDTPRVCFTAGHREAALDDPSEKGLSTL
ncbi:MAG: Gldg family protein, partial [Polyangiales bacterium]